MRWWKRAEDQVVDGGAGAGRMTEERAARELAGRSEDPVIAAVLFLVRRRLEVRQERQRYADLSGDTRAFLDGGADALETVLTDLKTATSGKPMR